MSLPTLIILLSLGINFSRANYVHHNSPHGFDIELQEHGVRITQKIRFENGLTITEVPNHLNISGGTYVFDEKKGLKLDVINDTKSCYVYVPYFSLGRSEEITLEEVVNKEEVENEDFLEVRPEYTLDFELMSIIGPELDIEQLPENMRQYCYEGFRLYSKKEVPADPNNVIESNDYGDILLDHPILKKEAKYGEPVPDFSELFQVLPPSNRSTRAKRAACIDEYGNTVSGCFAVDVACPSGCPAEYFHQKCQRTGSSYCYYTLKCSTLVPNKKCLWHIRSSSYKCNPCCFNKNCGDTLPLCPGLMEPDYDTEMAQLEERMRQIRERKRLRENSA